MTTVQTYDTPQATVLLDWGDTLMRVLPYSGRMADWPTVAVVPGAREALALLAAKYRLVVVSNAADSAPTDVMEALARVALDRYVTQALTPATVGATKEDPVFWSRVLEMLGVVATRAVAVGDDAERDIATATRAGIRTVWLRTGSSGATAGDEVISSMHELPDALRRLLAG